MFGRVGVPVFTSAVALPARADVHELNVEEGGAPSVGLLGGHRC